MIEKAKKLDGKNEYVCSDLLNWKPGEKVDLVMSMEVFYYFENQIENEAVVYTSGLAGIFKPGIPVGKITNSSEQLSFFSDFGQLSLVR